MYTDKIRETFERYSYKANTQITRENLYQFLQQLTPGQGYDKDVADELWEQASKGAGYIEVNSVCQTINDGINILQVKLDQINDDIKQLEREKAQAYNSNGQNRTLLARIDNDIANLHQDRQQFEQDLKLVTLPFGINLMGRNSQIMRYDYSKSGVANGGLNDSEVLSNASGTRTESDQLRYLLYFSIVFGVIEIIVIYGKYDFLNLMTVTCLLSIYLLNHFDNIYIKFTLGLIALSEVLDIIWLFMYADQKWNPPSVGNDSTYQKQYLRFIVFFTVVVIILKIPIGYFLYKIKNCNQAQYKVSMGLFKIILNANKSNPITRNLTSIISQ